MPHTERRRSAIEWRRAIDRRTTIRVTACLLAGVVPAQVPVVIAHESAVGQAGHTTAAPRRDESPTTPTAPAHPPLPHTPLPDPPHLGLVRKPAEHGVSFGLDYSSDFFTNAHGGKNTDGAFQYRGVVDGYLELDTKELGLWSGGTFFIDFLSLHGIDITKRYVGDIQALNNADGPNTTHVYEAWYEQSLFDRLFRLKLGRMDVNTDFAAGVYRGEFLNAAAGYSPNIPLITYPDAALGVEVFFEPVDWFYVGAGVYDALATATRTGFDTAFHSPNESFTIVESGLRPKLTLFGQKDMPGQYSVGGFYHSGKWPIYFNDLGGRLPARFETGNAGVYVAFDQLVYREPNAGKDGQQGLGLFFQFTWTPPDRNEISQHYGAGFQYTGLIPARDDDICGLSLQHVTLSGRIQSLEKRYSETDIEAFYKIQLNDWLSIKPDVQYVVDPNGNLPNALVAGVRFQLSL